MLPNHSPLAVAEQFGTLDTLLPGRIDLGVGRAPGSAGAAIRALRGDASERDFGQDVAQLAVNKTSA
jgi:alkanesulfonate monooxygenase SsuD/methylene tetrahydromethanopterin reductase-like flavin-dependent oxidoreductase (luciferase family)